MYAIVAMIFGATMFGVMLRPFSVRFAKLKCGLEELEPFKTRSLESLESKIGVRIAADLRYFNIHCILHHKHSVSNVLYNAITIYL